MRVSIIVAMSKNRVIGLHGDLPWRLSADLRRFKQLTMGHPIIMGRKTYDSIGRALPGRTSIVITRQTGFHPPDVIAVPGWDEALQAAGDVEEAFVIGGGEVYSQALPLANRIYLTAVETELEGDTFFPKWDDSQWQLVQEMHHPADAKNAFSMRFLVLDRVRDFPSSCRTAG